MTGLLLGIAFVGYIVVSYITAKSKYVNSDTESDFIICLLKTLAKFFIPYLGVCILARLWWLGLLLIVVYILYVVITGKKEG